MSSNANSLSTTSAGRGPTATNEPFSPIDPDFDMILAAVMETARGRWFLGEYVRRHRNADTGTLLAAIERIESLLMSAGEPPAPANDIAEPPDAVTAASLRSATAEIAAVRDQMHDVAESLIECGAPSFLCNDLKRRLGDLSRACARLEEAADRPPSAKTAPPAMAAYPQTPNPQPQRDSFADFHALSDAEKIALFT